MDQQKLDNFCRRNAGSGFPDYRTLNPDECKRLLARLLPRLGLPVGANGLDAVERVQELLEPARGSCAESGFNLSACLAANGLDSGEEVLVNWYRFDEVDQLLLRDLSFFFEDIWYPGLDDIEIFDEDLNWILSVSHDSSVGFARLGVS